MAGNDWRPGDVVRFWHQAADGPNHTVENVRVGFGGDMVTLVGMPGEFAQHLFVAVELSRW